MPFAFRLTAVCPPGHGLTIPPDAAMPRVVLAAEPVVVELTASSPDAHRATSLTLVGHGYSSKEDAQTAGDDAKAALRATSVAQAVPLDLGEDQARSIITRGLREALEKEGGVQIRGDVHGLDVYEEDVRPVKTFSASASGVVSRNLDDFTGSLEEFLRDPPAIDAELTLAVDLFSLAMFESSERARFLTFVTALEVLAEQEARPEGVRQHVDRLRSLTRDAAQSASSLEEKQSFESLRSALAELRKQSITSAVRDLVTAHVPSDDTLDGDAPERFVTRVYDVRSKLVHEGQHEDCARLVGRLRALVRAVLLGSLTG